MDDLIDLSRWRQLLDAYNNAVDEGPPFALLQSAQQRWMAARTELERFKARGPLGRVSERHSADDIQKVFAASVRDLKARADAAEQEAKRIDARSQLCAQRRAALRSLVDGVRRWASSQGVALPGDDASSPPTGFGGPTVSVLQARAIGGNR
jgi:hypothetical protein